VLSSRDPSQPLRDLSRAVREDDRSGRKAHGRDPRDADPSGCNQSTSRARQRPRSAKASAFRSHLKARAKCRSSRDLESSIEALETGWAHHGAKKNTPRSASTSAPRSCRRCWRFAAPRSGLEATVRTSSGAADLTRDALHAVTPGPWRRLYQFPVATSSFPATPSGHRRTSRSTTTFDRA